MISKKLLNKSLNLFRTDIIQVLDINVYARQTQLTS